MRTTTPILKIFFLISFFFTTANNSFSQTKSNEDFRKIGLAFFNNEDFKKALYFYKKAYDKESFRKERIYTKIVFCYKELEDYKAEETFIKNHIKSYPYQINAHADLIKLYRLEKKHKKSEKEYKKALKKCFLEKDFKKLINGLTLNNIEDKLLETYKAARKKTNYPVLFANNLADFYATKGNYKEMYNEYLNYLQITPSFLKSLQNIITTKFQSPKIEATSMLLKKQLISRINNDSKNITFSKLLIWLMIYQNKYEQALIQVAALDKRVDSNGSELIKFGNMMLKNKRYSLALKALNKAAKNSPITSPNHYKAKFLFLKSKEEQLLISDKITKDKLLAIDSLYYNAKSILKNSPFYKNSRTQSKEKEIVIAHSKFKAYQLGHSNQGIAMIENFIDSNRLPLRIKAECKIGLADIYLLTGNIWEADLLYAQVERQESLKYSELGEEAKFKSARIAFYKGDFSWAKTQLDVLKASSSKFIANDAIELSVLISDNVQNDSNLTPLTKFSEADLLVKRKKYAAADSLLKTILKEYPNHNLVDDILFTKYRIYLNQKKYTLASSSLKKLIEINSESIYIDKAMFKLATLYETKLNDKQKALSLYKKLLFDFKSSVYNAYARDNYRRLKKTEETNLIEIE